MGKVKAVAASLTADLAVLVALVESRGHPRPELEHRFLAGRRFRFDLAWPAYRVAFEREGGTWSGGRHTRPAGYRNDCVKYNLAAIGGWLVVRATADMLADGTAAEHLIEALAGRKPGGEL